MFFQITLHIAVFFLFAAIKRPWATRHQIQPTLFTTR